MLKQEQLEVTPRAIESAAARERTRAAGASGLLQQAPAGVGDRGPRVQSRPRAGRDRRTRIALRPSYSHASIVRCAVRIRPRRQRLEVATRRAAAPSPPARRQPRYRPSRPSSRRCAARHGRTRVGRRSRRARRAEPSRAHRERRPDATPRRAVRRRDTSRGRPHTLRSTEIDPDEHRLPGVRIADQHRGAVEATSAEQNVLTPRTTSSPAAVEISAGAPSRRAGVAAPDARQQPALAHRLQLDVAQRRPGACTATRSTALRWPSKIRPTEPSAAATRRTSDSSRSAGGRRSPGGH